MPSQNWTKTTLGAVSDTDGNVVGTANGLGTITINAATIVLVRGGFTLTIGEGVTVKFADTSSQIRVLNSGGGPGTLNCAGTATEPVVLTSSAGSPAADDWGGVETFQGSGSNVPTITMTHTTIEYARTGVFNVTTTGPHSVTLTDCLFRHVAQSSVQGISTSVPWTLTRCVFIKCTADHPASSSNNLIIISGAGGMEVDHCSIFVEIDHATSDIEIFQVNSGSNMDITDSIFVGTNNHVTRALDIAFVSGTGALTNSNNWYDVEGLGDYVPDASDQNQNPGYFDTDCSGSFGSLDLRPDFDTGVSTADSAGALLGALAPYNSPVPPDNGGGGEEEQTFAYADYTDPTFVPPVCDYDFFQGPYPDDWQEALYDRKQVPPHQLVVCIQIPNRGVDLDFVFAPGVPITLIDQGEDTITVDIGCWVNSMRALQTQRDVEFREYKGSDVDLLFVDWFGRLDPKIVGSLFYNRSWRGLRVEIGSWIHGTERVLKHGRFFLQDVTRRGGVTKLRLRDWFLETLNRPLRANRASDLSKSFTNDPNVDFDLDEVTIDSSAQNIESILVRFLDVGTADSRSFEVIGTESGLMGTGTIDDDFLSDDEGLAISSAAWSLGAAGTSFFVPRDSLEFNLSNDITGKPNDVIFEYLTTYGGLVDGVDVDSADFTAKGSLLPTQTEVHLRFTSSTKLLEACRVAALHGFVTLSANARGHVTLGGFKPTLQQQLNLQQNATVCSSNDLIKLETENLPIHNVIRASYNPLEGDGITHTGEVGADPTKWFRFPTADLGPDFNRSVAFYGETFPFDLELPGFRSGQEGALFAVLQNFWVFFEGVPTARERYKAETKLHNLNRDLEDIVFLDCERPQRSGWAQVIQWKKDPLRRRVGLTLVDVSDIVQPDFACGYAFCDAGHFTDDCWVAF